MKAKIIGQTIVLAFLLYAGIKQIIEWIPALEWSLIPLICTVCVCLICSIFLVIKKNEQKCSFIKKLNEQKKQNKKLQSELNEANSAIKKAQVFFENKENYDHINKMAHTFNQKK